MNLSEQLISIVSTNRNAPFQVGVLVASYYLLPTCLPSGRILTGKNEYTEKTATSNYLLQPRISTVHLVHVVRFASQDTYHGGTRRSTVHLVDVVRFVSQDTYRAGTRLYEATECGTEVRV
jgi:hypothetical protein